jgi:hypothetical protein
LFEIRKLSSITRFDNESQNKVASLPILVLDSRSRFSDLSFHSQLCFQIVGTVYPADATKMCTSHQGAVIFYEEFAFFLSEKLLLENQVYCFTLSEPQISTETVRTKDPYLKVSRFFSRKARVS